MMRKPLALANWKMEMTVARSLAFVRDFQSAIGDLAQEVDIILCPPYTALHPMAQALKDSPITLGGQNVSTPLKGLALAPSFSSEKPKGSRTGSARPWQRNCNGCWRAATPGRSKRWSWCTNPNGPSTSRSPPHPSTSARGVVSSGDGWASIMGRQQPRRCASSMEAV